MTGMARALPRLFVETPLAAGGGAELAPAQAHYLKNVMRLAPGREVRRQARGVNFSTIAAAPAHGAGHIQRQHQVKIADFLGHFCAGGHLDQVQVMSGLLTRPVSALIGTSRFMIPLQFMAAFIPAK